MTSRNAFYNSANIQNLTIQERNPDSASETAKLNPLNSGFIVIPSKNVTARPDITGYVLTSRDAFGKVCWAAPSSSGSGSSGGGNRWKNPVDFATTANMASLEGIGIIAAVDNGNVTNDSRILVKNQDTASQNGIYVSDAIGNWTRATDFAVGAEASGAAVFVMKGATLADKGFLCSSDDALVGDNLSWIEFTHRLTPAAGNDGEIQYRATNGSSEPIFQASSKLKWDNTNKSLIIGASGDVCSTYYADRLFVGMDNGNSVITNDTGKLVIRSEQDDTDITTDNSKSVNINNVNIKNNTVATKELILKEPTGSNIITVKAPSLTTDYTLTLPEDDGNDTDVLTTNGSGILSWKRSLENYNLVTIDGVTANLKGTGNVGDPYRADEYDDVIMVNGLSARHIAIQLPLIQGIGKKTFYIVGISQVLNSHIIQIIPAQQPSIGDPIDQILDFLNGTVITFTSSPNYYIIPDPFNSIQLKHDTVNSWLMF